tara:strand:+ start:667 stop:885 length:219 start_codon:yes stop_codon:yes gene_type:complete
MNINTFLLVLLVLAAYINLYLTIKSKRIKRVKRTELPISSKEWDNHRAERESYKNHDTDIKSWLKNKERLDK